MTERFLFYIWQFKLFDQQNCKTTSGETLQIIKPGTLNQDSGPDFSNGLIKLGETTWAGNIEIHINASDWIHHQHKSNKNYDNIILHVVLDCDKIILRENGSPIPTLELKDRLNWGVYENYKNLLSSRQWIPCAGQISKVNEMTKTLWLERLLITRMERKAGEISLLLEQNQNNLEDAFYVQLAKNFGFKTNAQPFELLAKSIPLQILAKHRNSLFQLEALLFGQAGLLDELFDEEYPQKLQREYQFLKHKFKLNSNPGHLWKFLRMRPINFPTIRIAQFASLVCNSSGLLAKIAEANSIKELELLFEISTSEYWLSHYRFEKKSGQKKKPLGKDSFENLVINTIAPMLFLLSHLRGEDSLLEKALGYLETINAEKNAITIGFEALGLSPNNAGQGQALIELKNNFCNHKRCLECGLGKELLK